MTYGNFKDYVAAFMQRSEASFVAGTVDILGVAINEARRSLERRGDFEMSRVAAKITLNTNGTESLLSTAVLFSDGVTSVNVKTPRKAFVLSGASVWVPIDIISRDIHVEKYKRDLGITSATTLADLADSQLNEGYKLVRFGMSVYVAPAGATNYGDSSTVAVKLDAIRWLDAYTADDDTDFLLEYCPDLVLMQTVKWLNLSMREDERIPVSAEAFAEAWMTMEDWNRSIAISDDDSRME